MPKLSVILITKNEASQIDRSLKSIAWADEIIVLDSGSTDNTIEICRQYTDKIFSTDWPGFGIQKQRALDKASHEWVLSLDADEVVTPELATEIQSLLQSNTSYDGFEIKRISNYCGRFIRYGDWKNDCPLRLFKRDKAAFTEDLVHERVIVKGKIGLLKSTMLHYSFQNLEQVLSKINFYSTQTAVLKFKQGKRAGLTKACIHAAWTFIRGYFFRRGFLEGREGFLLALSNALGTFYRYVKLGYLLKPAKYDADDAAL